MSLHLLVAFLAYWNIFILFSSFIHFLPTKNSNPMKLVQTKFWYFLEPLNNLCTYLLNAFLYSCFFISMKPASYNKPCWCVYWSTDPRTDIIQTSKQRTTQRNHEPPCLRVSILHHHHLATSIESLSSPLPPAPWPSPGPAPTSPRRSWAGTAARSPRAAPPPSRTCGVARWLRGLPSCRRGRGKLLALGPRYKTKLIFPAADRPMPGSTLSSSPRLNPTDSTTTAAAAAAAAAPTKL